MRSTVIVRCANLRTLGLDSSRQYSAAEIKAAFLERAKSTHPDAGGDAAHFRKLKDAYDALRGVPGAAASAAGSQTPAYNETHSAPQRDRSHIYAERYNDGDARPQPEKQTWDYGSGTRYTNNSTRSFYRPYTSNYYDPQATGFTREEVARAELAMRLSTLRHIAWNILIYGSALYLLYEYVLRPDAPPSREYQLGLTEKERQRRERELRQMQPQLQEHWSDGKKARYLEEWNNRVRVREQVVAQGLRAPYSGASSHDPCHAATLADSVALPSATALTQGAEATKPFPDAYCDMADEDAEIDS